VDIEGNTILMEDGSVYEMVVDGDSGSYSNYYTYRMNGIKELLPGTITRGSYGIEYSLVKDNNSNIYGLAKSGGDDTTSTVLAYNAKSVVQVTGNYYARLFNNGKLRVANCGTGEWEDLESSGVIAIKDNLYLKKQSEKYIICKILPVNNDTSIILNISIVIPIFILYFFQLHLLLNLLIFVISIGLGIIISRGIPLNKENE